MAVDFFVQPEYGREACSEELFSAYSESLAEAFLSSRFPVLISSSLDDSLMNEMFNPMNALQGIATPESSSRHASLAVSPDSWNRLELILDMHSNDKIRIHGSYLGRFTSDIAVQIFAYLAAGERFGLDTDMSKDRYHYEVICEEDWISSGRFRQSRIRYGAVLAPPEGIKIFAHPSLISYFTRFFSSMMDPSGDINHQLIDEKTSLHGKVKIIK